MNQSVYEHLISADSVCTRHQLAQGLKRHNREVLGQPQVRRFVFFSNLQVLGFRNDFSECLRADGKDVIGGIWWIGSIPVASTATKIVLGLVSVLFSVVASVVKAAAKTCSFLHVVHAELGCGLPWPQACPPLWPEARCFFMLT